MVGEPTEQRRKVAEVGKVDCHDYFISALKYDGDAAPRSFKLTRPPSTIKTNRGYLQELV